MADPLLEEVERLEKISQKENRMIEQEIHELASSMGSGKASRVIDGFRKMSAMNNELVELLERIEQGDFMAASRKLREIERKREDLARDLFEKLEQIDVEHALDLESIEKNLEKLDHGLEEDIRERAVEEAEQKMDSRPTMVVEEKPLQRFLDQVKKIQLGKGEETAGLFHYTNSGKDLVLDKYVPLKNRIPDDDMMDRSGTFNPGEDEERLLKESDGNIVFAHSHPPDDEWLTQEEIKSHSGMDLNYQGGTLEINLGLLAAPGKQEDWIWLVPQYVDGAQWKNMRMEVSRNGSPLSEKQLSSEYPQVEAYNRATVKTLAYQMLFDEETDWLHYYRRHVKGS